LSALVALPFIKTSIAVTSTGIIRPFNERTELKPAVSGIIDTILVQEGDTIMQGHLVARIKDNTTGPQITLNDIEVKQRLNFISDLELLITATNYNNLLLKTPLYRFQLSRFLFQLTDQQAAIKKASYEQEINTQLLKNKVIARKEHFDKEIESERLTALFNAFKQEQITNWQNDLERYKTEISQFTTQRNQLESHQKNHFLYAPVSGEIQHINTRYTGGFISAGETLCIISPQSDLIGECYISTRDMGLLKINQPVRFQIDAFDYNYFGILTGKIASIDNDFTLLDNTPVFKVRCIFDNTQLLLKNGYKGLLKKGLTFQARFIVTERTLWQLLFDKMDNWLNPTAPSPLLTKKQP
jgi:multidrug resistance efflux pump